MKFIACLRKTERLCWETNFHALFALMNILKTEALIALFQNIFLRMSKQHERLENRAIISPETEVCLGDAQDNKDNVYL